MITNFEEETSPITIEEMKVVDILVRCFSKRTKDTPIKGGEVCQSMKNAGYDMTEARLRKMVNHIRSQAKIPLIATSKGYYTSHDKDEISKQVKSLRDRSSAILGAACGLESFLRD